MKREIHYIILPEVGSTNTWAREHSAELQLPVAIRGVAQMSGRGQRGNTWEAEPGKNLTISIVLKPEGVKPSEQFSISEVVALGIVKYLLTRGIDAQIKWPNDIYVGDRKICGILIENSLFGSEIERSIIGIGLNVNQTEFLSPAPNPVSMSQLTGREYDLEEEMYSLVKEIEQKFVRIGDAGDRFWHHLRYKAALWRGDEGVYLFRDIKGDRRYEGTIADVEPEGFLSVRDAATGEIRKYSFKEVEFIL